jgi:hypothetical protein
MAAARQACECEPAYGIALPCWIKTLPKMKLMIVGDVCEVPTLQLFECPRYTIMGW